MKSGLSNGSKTVPNPKTRLVLRFYAVLFAGVAALSLAACAGSQATMSAPDYSGLSYGEQQSNLAQLSQQYQSNPRDKQTAIHFAAALRTVGQTGQAVAVLEESIGIHGRDADLGVAYAKALASDGRFEQALTVIDDTIQPDRPYWNALSVKGAILDQIGQHEQARVLYEQALLMNPQEPSLHANIGLSYAMTGDLDQAETKLRYAASLPGATSQVRQNLALVLGLQGKFDETRAIYAAELPPDQVEANMAYIRALLTQQNRWDVIEES
jgi:Flp pilus assembly protein TadD